MSNVSAKLYKLISDFVDKDGNYPLIGRYDEVVHIKFNKQHKILYIMVKTYISFDVKGNYTITIFNPKITDIGKRFVVIDGLKKEGFGDVEYNIKPVSLRLDYNQDRDVKTKQFKTLKTNICFKAYMSEGELQHVRLDEFNYNVNSEVIDITTERNKFNIMLLNDLKDISLGSLCFTGVLYGDKNRFISIIYY